MKLLHLSDLHLGKRVNEFSMLEDQKYILSEIIQIVEKEAPDAVLIAGDVYDKSVPPAEAVELFDDFLVRLSRLGTQVFVISGNHDSPERVAFGGRLMDPSGIHMSPVYSGQVQPVPLFGLEGQAQGGLGPGVLQNASGLQGRPHPFVPVGVGAEHDLHGCSSFQALWDCSTRALRSPP